MATNHQQFPRLSSVKWTTSIPPMVSEISLRSPPSSLTVVANHQPEVPVGDQRESLTSCNGSYMDGCTSDVRGGESSVRQCAACGQSISDRYLLHTMDGFWHVRCLRCSCCQVALAEIGTSCFSRAGMMLCKADYIRSVDRQFAIDH